MQQSLIGQPGEVSQNSLITFPVINEQSNQPFSQNVENQSLLETDHTRQLWKLPYYALLAKRGLFSHILARMFDCTYRQSPRHAMYHTNIPFFLRCTKSEKTWKAGIDTGPQTMLVACFSCLHVWLQFFSITKRPNST